MNMVAADDPQELARPYPGGRAQAESGSKIIENDYDAWKAVCLQPYRLPAGHPLLQQLSDAWNDIAALGLGGDAGAASIRYRVLAHAARALVPAGHGREAQALLTLWRHAFIHGHRLYATGLDRFLSSGASGRYTGFAQAAAGSETVEKHYQAWQQAAEGVTKGDPGFAIDAAPLSQARADIDQRGLTDGPGSAAGRYSVLADHARALPDEVGQRLPAAALGTLLELAMQAGKHSIRLDNTAIAIKGDAADQPAPYCGLPTQVATTAAHAHSEIPRAAEAPTPAGTGITARTAQKRTTQTGREQ